MDAKHAETQARKRWFDFELREVATRYHGDWLAFFRAKQAEDDARSQADLDKALKHPSPRAINPTDATQARALRVLQEEWRLVAQPQTQAIIAEARRVLAALQAGDLAAVARDSVAFAASAPNRYALALAQLREQQPLLNQVLRAYRARNASFGADLDFIPPAPARGMVGQVRVSFGPAAARPKEARRDSYPARAYVELWWSGQVMPEANGPLHAAPRDGTASPGRWRFYAVVTPYSRTPMYLQ